jgi:hypothetical protein
MKKHGASLLGLCFGLTLMLGLGVPAITMAADASPIVGIGKELSIRAPSLISDFWCTFPRRRTEL